jgi:hypothetical protein
MDFKIIWFDAAVVDPQGDTKLLACPTAPCWSRGSFVGPTAGASRMAGSPSSHARPVVGHPVRLESYRGDEAADIEGH